MSQTINKDELKKTIVFNVKSIYRKTIDEATPAMVYQAVALAGLVKGASKGEGLGNQFLANIREVDAIVHVVRCFEDSNVIHVDGKIDPVRDIETINLELIFSDIELIDRRIAKMGKGAASNKADRKSVV